jgi:hypothetical protein
MRFASQRTCVNPIPALGWVRGLRPTNKEGTLRMPPFDNIFWPLVALGQRETCTGFSRVMAGQTRR